MGTILKLSTAILWDFEVVHCIHCCFEAICSGHSEIIHCRSEVIHYGKLAIPPSKPTNQTGSILILIQY